MQLARPKMIHSRESIPTDQFVDLARTKQAQEWLSALLAFAVDPNERCRLVGFSVRSGWSHRALAMTPPAASRRSSVIPTRTGPITARSCLSKPTRRRRRNRPSLDSRLSKGRLFAG
jgi:hypothetical protein